MKKNFQRSRRFAVLSASALLVAPACSQALGEPARASGETGAPLAARPTLIPQVNPHELAPEVQQAYNKLPQALGIHKILAQSKSTFVIGREYSAALLGGIDLPVSTRELVILVVSELEGGTYVFNQHVPVALKAGVTEKQMQAIKSRNFDSLLFDPPVRALLTFTADVTENVEASEKNVREALKHYSPSVLVDTILIAGLYMTMDRITRTARVPEDPPKGGLANVGSVDRK
jgi:alkylhydroperoxidase family enzyme